MDPKAEQLIRLLHESPSDPMALEAVRSYLTEQGHHRSLAKLLEWWSDRVPGAAASAQALFDAAQAIERYGKDPQRTIDLYARALEREPTHSAALSCLETILSARGEYDRLESVLESQAAALARSGSGAPTRANALRRLGEVRATHLGNREGAIAAYREALTAQPKDAELMQALAQLFVERARSRKEPEADREAAADLYFRAAQTIDSTEGARCLEQALELAPGHLDALEHLERLAVDVDDRARLCERWAKFLQHAPSGVAVDKRRALLAKAYADAGRELDAIECLRPLASRGHPKAQKAIEQLQRRAALRSERPEPPSQVVPRAERTPHPRTTEESVVVLMRALEEAERV